MRNNRPVQVKDVKVRDDFWSPLQALVMDTVLPYQADIMEDKIDCAEKSRAIENFRIAAGESGDEFYGMVFQDSDFAKWMEAAAHALAARPDAKLEAKVDELVALIGRAQEADGYLNTYFTLKAPDRKWQNLAECHELYCAGHMMEAAVAHYFATGKTAFLDIMRRNADLIVQRFGKGPRQVPGVPGHQEIELGLLRMYEATGDERYLQTAQFFVDERGQSPEYLTEECKNRDWYHWGPMQDPEYNQRHLPVREQKDAVGHSVRAVYMYTAMAELAAKTGDESLAQACRNLWQSITGRRMYITGGIGSTVHGEAFSADYELPNDLVYAETCASIAMMFFARRMLELAPKGEYADILEKEMYNGALSGMQLDGKRFFYVNPLEVVPGVSGVLPEYKHVLPSRPEWYGCACCPPNVARLVSSIGQYAWGSAENGMYAHTPLGGDVRFECAGGVAVQCKSSYPWHGEIEYILTPDAPGAHFFFAVHIPAWCENWQVKVNGEAVQAVLKDGYVYLQRDWQQGDSVDLHLDMEPRRVYANINVRADAGCVALMRGPVVYCLEEVDNGGNLPALRLPRDAALSYEETTLDGIGKTVVLRAEGVRLQSGDALYSSVPPVAQAARITAVPYYTWANRKPGGMRVWLMEI